jgi:hypothetical protein
MCDEPSMLDVPIEYVAYGNLSYEQNVGEIKC